MTMDAISTYTAAVVSSLSSLNPERMAVPAARFKGRNRIDSSAVAIGSGDQQQSDAISLPVVDMAELKSGSSASRARETQRVAAACRDWGFFQVVNHGVPMAFVHKLREQCLDVFALPPERKDRISRRSQLQQQLWGYDFRPHHGPLEVLQLNAWDPRQLHINARELFPSCSGADHFIGVYEEADRVLRGLAIEILDVMIRGLRVDAKHFQAHREESQGVLRANYYHQSHTADQVLGLKPHVDGNLLTVLHQQDVSGLEVLKDGSWIPVPPRHDAFCVNVADIMQVLANGEYRSVQHRAVVPKGQARLSMAYFLTPVGGVPLVPAPELEDLSPVQYRPFTWEDFLEASKGVHRPYPSVLPLFLEQRNVIAGN